MRSRWTRRAALPLLALGFASCTDSTGPNVDLSDFLIDFCSSEVPVFFAVQNDEGPWTRVTPDAEGTFSFQAADRMGLAIVHQEGSDFTTEFLFATAEELQAMNGIACNEASGGRVLTGSVADVVTGERAVITMSESSLAVNGPLSDFSFNSLPNRPVDLVAQRDVLTLDGPVPDRAIVRRAVNLTSGSTMPVLDFASAESQSMPENGLTVSGLLTDDDANLLLDFVTATGSRHPLFSIESFPGTAVSIYGIPSGLTQNGDVHDLDVFAFGAGGGSYRGARQFYRTSSDRTVTLGPGLNTPTFTTVDASEPVILRMQLQSQPDYASFVWVNYLQDNNGFRDLSIYQTAAYLGGTPATWDITIPDMSGVSGFPAAAGLQNEQSTSWYVDAFDGEIITFLGVALDGTSFRYANRNAAVATAQQSRVSARAAVRRPRLSMRGGAGGTR